MTFLTKRRFGGRALGLGGVALALWSTCSMAWAQAGSSDADVGPAGGAADIGNASAAAPDVGAGGTDVGDLGDRLDGGGDVGPLVVPVEAEQPAESAAAELADVVAPLPEMPAPEGRASAAILTLGARIGQAEGAGAEVAQHAVEWARRSVPVVGDPRLAEVIGDVAKQSAADAVGLTLEELSQLTAIDGRSLVLRAARDEAVEDLANARTAARFFSLKSNHLRQSLLRISSAAARVALRGLYVVTRQVARQASREVFRLEREVTYLDTALAYLERRRVAVVNATTVQASPVNVEEIQAEIDRDRRLLDREAEITERVEQQAEAVERRAEDARVRAERDARLSEVASQWALVAPELTRLADERRIEEARLAQVTQRREDFLRQQARITERIGSISLSPQSDETRATRADQLYTELSELRWDAREDVAVIRDEERRRAARVEELDSQVSSARGALDLAINTPMRPDEAEIRDSLIELRQAELQLAEERLRLESLRRSLLESQWRLIQRQVTFFAQATDNLVELLSGDKRDEIYAITGWNLFEARHNIRDRVIGLSLMAEDRFGRLDELTSWLGSVDGVLWLSELLVILILILAAYRVAVRYRDRALLAVVQRLERFAWVGRHIRLVLKTAELLREVAGPLFAYLAITVLGRRIAAGLPELELLREGAVKLVVLWLLMRWTAVLVLPRSLRAEKGTDQSTFAVNLVELDPKRARLVLLSVRVWLVYLVAASITIDVVQFLFGRGFAAHLFEVTLDWGQLVLVYLLLWFWRDEIVMTFKALSGQEDSRLSRILSRHKDRIYTVLLLAVVAGYLIGLWLYRFGRRHLVPRTLRRRVETFFFRKRIEMAQAQQTGPHQKVTAEQDVTRQQPFSEYFVGGHAQEAKLTVPRSAELAAIGEVFAGWRDRGQAGAVAVAGEPGVGRTTLLDQFARTLPRDLPLVRHDFDRRITTRTAALAELSGLLEVEAGGAVEHLVDAVLEGPRRVVLLDDCHLLFLRALSGFEALDTVLSTISLTATRVFWILAFNRYAWEYLNRVYDRAHHFSRTLVLRGLDEEQLRDTIERRNTAANLHPDFKQLVVSGRTSARGRFYEVVKTAEGYYRLLAEYAQGNPTVALHFWCQSLVPRSKRIATVTLFKTPDDERLKALGERQLFALTAIAQHESLTPDEMAQVVEVEPELCELDINYLSQVEMVVIDDLERARLAVPFLRAVTSRLRLSNLLYFTD